MANTQRPDPLSELRGLLAANESRAQIFGLGSALRAVRAAVDELERREGVLAEVLLTMVELGKVTLSAGQIQALGSMNDHARAIARRLLEERR